MKHLYWLTIFSLIACNQKQETTSGNIDTVVVDSDSTSVPDPFYSLERIQANEIPADTSLVLSFNEKGAIGIYPDSVSLVAHLKITDEESWNTIIEDYTYYESLAIDTLESKGVKVHAATFIKRRYYKFKLSDDRNFYADMDKMRGEWGMILYNGKDIPTFCDPFSVGEIMDSVMNR